jgi:hypothetical protein
MTTPPSTLYHYTSQSGLLGIFASNSLWASKIHYLNDSSEYELALKLAATFLADLQKGERSTRQRRKIKALLSNLRMIEHMNVCVCSFTENRDQLSQWRAYTDGGSGFSIGFNTQHLETQAANHDFRLAKCNYDAAEQRGLVEQLVLSSLAKDFNTTPSAKHPTDPRTIVVKHVGGDFWRELSMLAPLLKNAAFREEAEWRLISLKGIDVRKMSFRAGKSMLIPYISIPLNEQGLPLLNSLVVGPTPHPRLAKLAAESLVSHYAPIGLSKVQLSEVPYRAW